MLSIVAGVGTIFRVQNSAPINRGCQLATPMAGSGPAVMMAGGILVMATPQQTLWMTILAGIGVTLAR
jgi:hypothetical protein